MIPAFPTEQCEAAQRPRITVVTICLNDLRGLQATFASVREQTVAPDQWVVVDGASSDGTRQWLESLDWPLLTWSSDRDGGIYEAMNKGLRRAGGTYALFLNSGDTLAGPDVLAVVSDELVGCDHEPTILFGDCLEVASNGKSHLRRARPVWWVPIGMPTTHQAMFFRTDALTDGFDIRYRLSGDYAALCALYARHRGRDFRYLPATLCRFGLGGRSDLQSSLLLRENFEIRRRILRMGMMPTAVLHALHHVHYQVKRHVPALHRLFRYG